MLIRFKECEKGMFNESRMICSTDVSDYAEYVKAIKAVNSVYIDEFYRQIWDIALFPAEDEDHINCIDVYVELFE
jgi:hypothetical protein